MKYKSLFFLKMMYTFNSVNELCLVFFKSITMADYYQLYVALQP